jgi:hypothetical protein
MANDFYPVARLSRPSDLPAGELRCAPTGLQDRETARPQDRKTARPHDLPTSDLPTSDLPTSDLQTSDLRPSDLRPSDLQTLLGYRSCRNLSGPASTSAVKPKEPYK